jgi:cysteinyl-tRNA synthetase
LFKQGEYAGQFSQYDADGIPTHTADGEEVAKSRKKKLTKEWEMQKKLHAEFLGSS